MRSSHILPVLAVAGLMAGNAMPANGATFTIPMCLGGIHSMPVRGDDENGPSKSPGACHAVCCRGREKADSDDCDSNI